MHGHVCTCEHYETSIHTSLYTRTMYVCYYLMRYVQSVKKFSVTLCMPYTMYVRTASCACTVHVPSPVAELDELLPVVGALLLPVPVHRQPSEGHAQHPRVLLLRAGREQVHPVPALLLGQLQELAVGH